MYSQYSRQTQHCIDTPYPIVHQGLEKTTTFAKMGTIATAKITGFMWGVVAKAMWALRAPLIGVFRSSIEQDLEDANDARLWWKSVATPTAKMGFATTS